jgi:hypothetical protein
MGTAWARHAMCESALIVCYRKACHMQAAFFSVRILDMKRVHKMAPDGSVGSIALH